MKNGGRQTFLLTFLPGTAGVFLILYWVSVQFIRSLGAVVSFLGEAFGLGETAAALGRIFGQLTQAEVMPPILLPLAFAMVCGWLLWLGVKTGRTSRIGFSAVGIVLLLIPALLLTIWLTSVNGVRFDGVILSLIRMIRAGALDSL